MKIAQLTPGSGDNFYCANCLRDAELVKELRRKGHDILMIPMYLPLQADKDEKVSNAPVFFGGINVYLQQKFPFFRKTPRWLDRLFDRPVLLKLAGKKSDMTSAKELGELTISMLQGKQGRQKKELDRLVEWLVQDENKPDIVCLSNALLSGLSEQIKEKLNVPVVCLLEDEDTFVDNLPGPFAEKAWKIISQRCKDIDAFISVSRHYANIFKKKAGIEDSRLFAVNPGIAIENYKSDERKKEPATIGFLSCMSEEKGLDILVDAFIILKQNEKLKGTKLCITGGQRRQDKEFIRKIRRKLTDSNLHDDVEFLTEFDQESRLNFLQRLTALSVPERRSPAYGLYVLEALASSVIPVQPRMGVFIEMLGSGGGVLHEPNTPEAIAKELEKILSDSDYAKKLAGEGRKIATEKFNVEKSAEEMLNIYKKVKKDFEKKNA